MTKISSDDVLIPLLCLDKRNKNKKRRDRNGRKRKKESTSAINVIRWDN